MAPAVARRATVEGQEEVPLDTGWEAAATAPGAATTPAELRGLDWYPARVPGTAATALVDAGIGHEGRDLDAEDWWFRTEFRAQSPTAGEEAILRLDGIATVAEVFLNGEPLVRSESMFAAHELDVGRLLGDRNELAIRCHALGPLLRERRRPRARWRTRVVGEQNLRFFRTMLLGRAPGFAPGPAAVGPWRAVSLVRRRGLALDELRLRPRLAGAGGALAVRARLRALDGRAPTAVEIELSGPSGTHRAPLTLSGDGDRIVAEGVLEIPDVARWWPHTHGEPALHRARLVLERADGSLTVDAGRVGFRSLAPGAGDDHDVEADGLELVVNGVDVFARGAVWTPVDPIGLAPSEVELRAALETARQGGLNIVRVPGTGAYESDAFYDLCDELGLLVWQDFMFANLDYPVADEDFRAEVEREARAILDRLAGRPSVVVLCGNSEVEQQAAMFGLDPSLGRGGELFGELLPGAVRDADADPVYVPSAPCGGELPFRTDTGVANYFGVGAYLRPLDDARRAGVRFASECLAFANVPGEAAVEELLGEPPADAAVGGPRWKSGVPRDVGSGWDFDDVRDHYLGVLFGVDPTELRSVDPHRYLELSRAVSGELMAEVFGEWRRRGSPCGGGIVLWLRDLVAGAGWGLVDHRGEPKVAYHHLRRALAPIAVWTTDEGLGGIVVHVANDRGEPLRAQLRVGLYSGLERRVAEARESLELPVHGACERNVEALLGRFVDASWAYRFGPPAQDLIVASLEQDRDGEPRLLSQAVRFPAGRPTSAEPAAGLGLEATAVSLEDGSVRVSATSRRLAYGVRVQAPGYRADDEAFAIEPGHARELTLLPRDPGTEFAGAVVTALNLEGRIRIAAREEG